MGVGVDGLWRWGAVMGEETGLWGVVSAMEDLVEVGAAGEVMEEIGQGGRGTCSKEEMGVVALVEEAMVMQRSREDRQWENTTKLGGCRGEQLEEELAQSWHDDDEGEGERGVVRARPSGG